MNFFIKNKYRFYSFCTMFITLLLLQCMSYSHARSFGHITAPHVSRAIKKQIRAAIVPVLKTKKYKIQYPKNMHFSKSKRYLVLSMQGGYISLWDMKKGKEIDHIKLNSITPVSFAIDETNKKLYIVDEKGLLYGKALVAGERLEKVSQAQKNYYFKFVKVNSDKLILGTKKNSIVLFDKNDFRKKISGIHLDYAIVSMDVTKENNQILVSTKNKKLAVYQYIKQTEKISLIQKWQLSNTVSKVLFNNQGDGIALQFKNGKYAYIRKNGKKFGSVHLFDKNVLAMDFANNVLNVYTKNNTFFKQDINTGRVFDFRKITSTEAKQAQLYSNGKFALIPKHNNGISLIQIKSDKKVAQLISTRGGWAVIDKYGRYDGDEEAFHDVSWEANGNMLELDQFSKKYFEPGLLAKVIRNDQKMITSPDAKIPKGVYLPPEVKVEILSDKLDYSTQKKVTVQIIAEVEDKINLLHDIKVYHNGKRVPDNTVRFINSRTENSKKIKEWQLDVFPTVGNNEFFVEVSGWEDIAGRSDIIRFSTKEFVSSNETARFYIRSIGINKYASDDLTLNFAVSDAKTIFELFSTSNLIRKNLSGNPEPDVRTLILDKQASKKAILALLEKNHLRSNKNDWLVVFMAGHGVVVDNQWYFLPQEATSDQDMDKVSSAWLSSKELMEKFVAIPSQKIVLIIDACQSGAATVDFNDFHQRRALRGLSKETGIHVITATRADQDAPEFSELGHGLFTYVLLKGMKKNTSGYFNADLFPKDGQLTVTELQDYVVRMVPILAHKMAPKYFRLVRGQDGFDDRIIVTPVASSQGKDFVIFK